jgi:hypothetical protein
MIGPEVFGLEVREPLNDSAPEGSVGQKIFQFSQRQLRF